MEILEATLIGVFGGIAVCLLVWSIKLIIGSIRRRRIHRTAKFSKILPLKPEKLTDIRKTKKTAEDQAIDTMTEKMIKIL